MRAVNFQNVEASRRRNAPQRPPRPDFVPDFLRIQGEPAPAGRAMGMGLDETMVHGGLPHGGVALAQWGGSAFPGRAHRPRASHVTKLDRRNGAHILQEIGDAAIAANMFVGVYAGAVVGAAASAP